MPGSPIAPIPIKLEGWERFSKPNRDSTKEQEFKRAFYAEFKLKVAHQWTSIDMDSPKIPALVDRLRQLKSDSIAHIPMAYLTLTAIDEEKSSEWFLIQPNTECNWWSDPFPTIKADQIAPGAHIGEFGVFSEEFVASYKNSGLNGMEFIWIKDVGRFNARQWFRGIPLLPIGRGVDHPWFDPSKLRGEDPWQPSDPQWRKGVNHFGGDQLRQGVRFGVPHRDTFFDLLPHTRDLHITASIIVLREHLPAADFAYTWMSGFGNNVCCNRGVKDFIIIKSLARPEQFIPILVVDAPPSGCANLDASKAVIPACPLQHGAFETRTDLDLMKWREWSADEYKKHFANPKPKRKAKLGASLALLKDAKARRGDLFGTPVTKAMLQLAEQRLGITIPDGWRKVLRIANGFQAPTSVPGCDHLLPAEALPSYQEREMGIAKGSNPDFPNHYLFVSHSLTGDSCVLDLSAPGDEGECPVLCISHETQQPERTWPSIAAFLEEVLTEMPKSG